MTKLLTTDEVAEMTRLTLALASNTCRNRPASTDRWPPLRAQGRACWADLEPNAFRLLQIRHDLEKIARLRIASRPEHPHQTFCRTMSDVAQFRESDCCIDEIAKNDLSGFHIAGEKVLDPFAKKRFAKARVALNARPDRFFEVSCQSHWSHLSLPLRCL